MSIILLFMYSQYSMNDWNFSTFNFEHNDLTNANWLLVIICQEEKVTAVKSWLHTTTTTEYLHAATFSWFKQYSFYKHTNFQLSSAVLIA